MRTGIRRIDIVTVTTGDPVDAPVHDSRITTHIRVITETIRSVYVTVATETERLQLALVAVMQA